MTTTPALVGVALMLAAIASEPQAPAQKGNQSSADVSTAHLDFAVSVNSLEELVQRADAVVLGEVRQRQMAIRRTPMDERTVLTEYRMLVEEAVKDDGHVPLNPESLTVVVVGGSFIKGAFLPDSSSVAPHLRPGERSMMFLRWWPEANVHVLLTNAGGAFRFSETEVVPLLEGSPVAQSLRSRDSLIFVSDARVAAKTKRPR